MHITQVNEAVRQDFARIESTKSLHIRVWIGHLTSIHIMKHETRAVSMLLGITVGTNSEVWFTLTGLWHHVTISAKKWLIPVNLFAVSL
jgi:hypothetical protein